MSKSSARINLFVTVLLILAPLSLLAGAFFIGGLGKTGLRESYGGHYERVAKDTAEIMDAYVSRVIHDVAILARMPEVRAAAVESNSKHYVLEEVKAIDKVWTETRAAPLGLEPNPLNTPVASFFAAAIKAAHPVYQEIILADQRGRLAAASNPTSDYDQSHEPWWQLIKEPPESCSMRALGCPYVSDVMWDESAAGYGFDVSVPVLDGDGKTLVGVLKIVVDPREILAFLDAIRLSGTTEVDILHGDSKVMLSKREKLQRTEEKFFAAGALEAAVENTPDQRLLHFSASAAGEKRLVGIALDAMPNTGLDWTVAVYQAKGTLFEPIYAQIWQQMLIFTMLAIAIWAVAIGLHSFRKPEAEPAGVLSDSPASS